MRRCQVKATCDLTRDDLAAFVEFHQRTSPASRRQGIGCFAFCLGGLLILPVTILLTTDKPLIEAALAIWPLLLGPLLFAVLGPPYIRWRTRQMSNWLLSEGQNRGFYGKCELSVGDEALTETRPSGSTSRNWSAVERIVTTPAHLFVYTSGVEAYIVPRRAFFSESEFIAFVEQISRLANVPVQTGG